jgi:arylsulfatase A-like enzyme
VTAPRRLALAAGLVALAAAAAVIVPSCGAGPAGPDVILIVWDTARADRTQVGGYALPTTPRLKELAAEGTAYRHCYTPSPWTPPAHASLFTGLIPSRHGLREGYGDRVHPGIPLLAETMAAAGYETVAAPANPLLGVSGLLDGFGTVLPMTPGAEKDSGDTIADRVEAWAKARAARGGKRRPLFLFVNLMDSHIPLVPSREDLVAVHGERAAKVPAGGSDVTAYAALDHLLGLRYVDAERIGILDLAYDGGMRAADRVTARILGLFRGGDGWDRAFVAVTADHGECLGEHGELEHRMSIREPALHVPLVVRWPGRLAAGRVEDAQVRLQDLHRTILDAAGVAVPRGTGTDSLSLGEASPAPREAVAQLQATSTILPRLRQSFPVLPPLAAERLGSAYLVHRSPATGPSTRKLVLVNVEAVAGGAARERTELYDLVSDPGEDRDLLAPGGSPPPADEVVRLKARAAEAVR